MNISDTAARSAAFADIDSAVTALTDKGASVEDITIESAAARPSIALASQRRSGGDMALLARIGGEWTFSAAPYLGPAQQVNCYTEVGGCSVILRTIDHGVVSVASRAIAASSIGLGSHDFGAPA